MYLFEIILLFCIIYLYSHFSGRIKKLEDEISELKQTKTTGNFFGAEKIQNPEIQAQEPKTTTIAEGKTLQKAFPVSFKNEKEKEFSYPKSNCTDSLFAFIKQNLLTIIGIFTLVLGIGYFVKYAIDKNWIGETARFGIGILTGLGILAIGFFLKKNYKIFSSIISGGGLAVLYLSVTLAFREYHIFSQNTAFAILILITVLSVIIAWFYNSETIVIFAMIGGFGSPLMVSTGVSNYPFLFTYITFLNLGMLAIAFLKNWKSVGWIAFFITYLYLLSWIFDKEEALTIWFAVIFYLIFYAFGLRNYFKKGNTAPSDILLLVVTNVISISVIVYVFKTLKLEPVIIFPIVFAVINAGFVFYESTKKRINLFHPVFVGITLSLITIAVAIQFKTHLITSLWAIETVLLLYLWRKTQQQIFKTSFLVLLPLVIFAEFFTWSKYTETTHLEPFLNSVFLTGILVSICFGINYFLFKDEESNKTKLDWNWKFFLKILFYGNLFIVGLAEISYQIRTENSNYSIITMILYALYFIFILLIFSKLLLNPIEEKVLVYLTLILSAVMASVPEFGMSLFRKEFHYGYYLLYLIPFIFAAVQFVRKKFYLQRIDIRFASFAVIYVLCFEIFHFYVWMNLSRFSEIHELKTFFNIFYLPMIWTALAIISIFIGMKKQLPELVKIGFALIIFMAGKLYLYDVWKMDNISRIIAFIVLGIVLLTSSFTFQKLKLFIKDMVEEKDDE